MIGLIKELSGMDFCLQVRYGGGKDRLAVTDKERFEKSEAKRS